MSGDTRPSLPKPCPICKVAMLAGKSAESAPDFDIFTCLRCGTTVEFSSKPTDGSERKN